MRNYGGKSAKPRGYCSISRQPSRRQFKQAGSANQPGLKIHFSRTPPPSCLLTPIRPATSLGEKAQKSSKFISVDTLHSTARIWGGPALVPTNNSTLLNIRSGRRKTIVFILRWWPQVSGVKLIRHGSLTKPSWCGFMSPSLSRERMYYNVQVLMSRPVNFFCVFFIFIIFFIPREHRQENGRLFELLWNTVKCDS